MIHWRLDMENKYTFCRICEASCGFVAEVEDNRIVNYYPDKEHPVSKGYSCPKGRHMPKLLYHPKRIMFPLKRSGDQFDRISWDQAIDEIGTKVLGLKEKYGPHSIGSYIGAIGFNYSSALYSGAFFSAIGTRNLYGQGSQDCNNKFAHSQMFYGSPMTIIAPDFDNIDCFIATGTNPQAAHFTFTTFPRPMVRLKEMEKRGCKIFWINPRKIEAAKAAGEHFFIRPNTDIYLLIGMINYVLENDLEDKQFIATYSKGIERVREIAQEFGADLDKIEGITGISKQDITRMTETFLDASKNGGASLYGRTGTDRGPFATLVAWARDVFNFITGNVDKKGNYCSGGFFSTGDLAIPEIGKGSFSQAEVRSRIGNFPQVLGTLPGATMADEILTPGDDQIRAMFINAGDPLISCANTKRLESAFRSLELLVSIDLFVNDTGILADYVLPATTFLEREEFASFTAAYNPMGFVNYSPTVVQPGPEVKSEWEIFNLLGEKLGFPSLGDQPMDLIKSLCPGQDPEKFEEMRRSVKGIYRNVEKKVQFNVLLPDGIRFHDKLIPLVPDDLMGEFDKFREYQMPYDENHPFSLISGRQVETINSYIHARGETNYCFINTEDAQEMGIEDNDMVVVSSIVNSIEIPAKITPDLLKGVIWIPHGWGRTVEDVPEMAVGKRGVNVNLITDDDWRKLESYGMVMLDGIQVNLERR
jgi:formate dehydrogenase